MAIEHRHAGPPQGKFLVDSVVESAMFICGSGSAGTAEASVAAVPQVPLTEKKTFKRSRQPAEGRLAAARLSTVCFLDAKPRRAPAADEEVSPPCRLLGPEGRAQRSGEKPRIDLGACTDLEQKLWKVPEKVGCRVQVTEVSGKRRCVELAGGVNSASVGASENM